MIRSVFTSSTNRKQIINHLAGLLLFFVPLSKAYPNILLIPLLLLVGYDIYREKKLNISFSKPYLLLSLSIFFFVLIAVIKGSLFLDIDIYLKYFTVLVLMIAYQQVSKIKTVENYYLSGLFIAIVISILKIIEYKKVNPDFLFTTGQGINDVLWEDRPYAAFMLVLGVFVCLRRISLENKKSWFFVLIAGIFLVFCNYISARLSLFLATVTIIHFMLFRFKIGFKTKAISIIILFLGVTTMAVLNKSLLMRTPLDNSSEFEKMIKVAKDREPRSVIWNCASILLKTDTNALWGVSNHQQSRQDLVDCYGEQIINREEKRHYYMSIRFNTHNQFFDLWLNGGIIPFLFLVASFIFALFSKQTSPNMRWVFFLFFCFFMVENVLYRQMGFLLFGVFISVYNTRLSLKTVDKK